METEAEYVTGVDSPWLANKQHYAAVDTGKHSPMDTGVSSVELGSLMPEAATPHGPQSVSATSQQEECPPELKLKVTMYQCAQCEVTFETLDKCMAHQCCVGGVAAAASAGAPVLQPAGPALPAKVEPGTSVGCQIATRREADSIYINYRWAVEDTTTLMELLIKSVDKFANTNLKRRYIWRLINRQMQDRGFATTQLQCENRWKTLKAMYRKSQQSGSNPPFYKNMCTIAETYPILMRDGAPLPPGAEDNVGCAATPARPCKWTEHATLSMLALIKAHRKEYEDTRVKRRVFWTQLADEMADRGLGFTAEQCEGRLRTLLTAYRRVQDNENEAPEEFASTCYLEVDELIQLIPQLASTPLLAPGAPAAPTRARARRRRRKGTALGTACPRLKKQREMLQWLQNWLEDQKKWDEAMQTALRQQHVERQRILQLVLDEVRSGKFRIPASKVEIPPQKRAGPLSSAAPTTIVSQVLPQKGVGPLSAAAPTMLVSQVLPQNGAVPVSAAASSTLVSQVLPQSGAVAVSAAAPTTLVSQVLPQSGAVAVSAAAPTTLVSQVLPHPASGADTAVPDQLSDAVSNTVFVQSAS